MTILPRCIFNLNLVLFCDLTILIFVYCCAKMGTYVSNSENEKISEVL